MSPLAKAQVRYLIGTVCVPSLDMHGYTRRFYFTPCRSQPVKALGLPGLASSNRINHLVEFHLDSYNIHTQITTLNASSLVTIVLLLQRSIGWRQALYLKTLRSSHI